MHDELFKKPAVVARYRAGPYAEARERFLKQARAEGYSLSTLERIAWVLLTVAKAVHLHGGKVSSTRLKSLLFRHIRLSKALATLDRGRTRKTAGGWSRQPDVMAFLRAL